MGGVFGSSDITDAAARGGAGGDVTAGGGADYLHIQARPGAGSVTSQRGGARMQMSSVSDVIGALAGAMMPGGAGPWRHLHGGGAALAEAQAPPLIGHEARHRARHGGHHGRHHARHQALGRPFRLRPASAAMAAFVSAPAWPGSASSLARGVCQVAVRDAA